MDGTSGTVQPVFMGMCTVPLLGCRMWFSSQQHPSIWWGESGVRQSWSQQQKGQKAADGQKGSGVKQQNKTVADNKEKKIVWKEEGSVTSRHENLRSLIVP